MHIISIDIEFSVRSLWNVLSGWPLLLVDSELIATQVHDTITNFRLQQLRLHSFYIHNAHITDMLLSR